MNSNEIRQIVKKIEDVITELGFDRFVDWIGGDESDDEIDNCFRVSDVERMDSVAPIRNNPVPPMV